MIFVKNKTDKTLSRLGVAMFNANPKIEKSQKEKPSSDINNIFQQDNELPPIIKIDQKKLIEKQREKENQINEKYAYNTNTLFSLKKKQFYENKKKKKNYVVKLKNNMLFQLNVPGCTPYDPYLINICKNAIVNIKDELPNYKEIIKKINTEFGIDEENNLIEVNSDKMALDTFNSFKSFSKTKTNFTRDKNTNNTEMNTVSSFNKESEKPNNKKEISNLRRASKKR